MQKHLDHIKVIGSRSRSYEKKDNFTYFNLLIFCMWLQVINKVKVTHQDEGHIKVKVKYLHLFKFNVAHTLCKRVVCIRLKCYLFHYVSTFLFQISLLTIMVLFHFCCIKIVFQGKNWIIWKRVHTKKMKSIELYFFCFDTILADLTE